MKISLIICTYNRSDILQKTLLYFNDLVIPRDTELELVLVDNNSDDDTQSVIRDFIAKFCKLEKPVKAEYYFEETQGLSHARNRGYLESSGEYIAYTDDECIIPNNWLEEIVNIIKKQTPAFLGGPYYGKYFPGDSSNWFKESFGDSYLIKHDLLAGPLQRHYLSGGNIIIRRDVFDKIGLFDPALGMSGKKSAYGEEVDLQKRMIEKFPEEKIWYEPNIFVWHCIREEKMKLKYLFKDSLIRGYSSAELQRDTFKKLKFAPVMLIYYFLKAFISFVIKFFQSLFSSTHFFTLLYEDCKNNIWSNIGRAWFRTKMLFKLV